MGKKTKNFIASLVFLIILAGVVFFIGWTQFWVKPDSVGVLVSKTGGVSEKLIKSGDFSWHWEFLLPTNAELKTFKMVPYSFEKNISGTLPSGEVYSGLYKNPPDFSYNFDFTLSFSFAEDELVGLVKSGRIENQESFEEYLTTAADETVRASVPAIIAKYDSKLNVIPEIIDYSDLLSKIDISKKFPGVEIKEIEVKNVKIPDFSLYEKTRKAYLEKLKNSFDLTNIIDFSNSSRSGTDADGTSESEEPLTNEKALEILEKLKTILSSSTNGII